MWIVLSLAFINMWMPIDERYVFIILQLLNTDLSIIIFFASTSHIPTDLKTSNWYPRNDLHMSTNPLNRRHFLDLYKNNECLMVSIFP